jgi:hypothetical protein
MDFGDEIALADSCRGKSWSWKRNVDLLAHELRELCDAEPEALELSEETLCRRLRRRRPRVELERTSPGVFRPTTLAVVAYEQAAL